jgi:hypothetical protein
MIFDAFIVLSVVLCVHSVRTNLASQKADPSVKVVSFSGADVDDQIGSDSGSGGPCSLRILSFAQDDDSFWIARFPGLKSETSTPRTKTCSWGPRTWGIHVRVWISFPKSRTFAFSTNVFGLRLLLKKFYFGHQLGGFGF